MGPADVFIVFGAGILLFFLGYGAFTLFLYAYHWIKGDKDW
jgi:hypothetical protein